MTFDYGDDANIDVQAKGKPKTEDSLRVLRQLAQRQIEQEAEVERCEAVLRTAQKKLEHTSQHEIPTLMDEIGLKDFTLADGRKVIIEDNVKASIPKKESERTPKALRWLIENKHGQVIKTNLSVQFAINQDKAVRAAQTALTRLGLEPSVDRGVHPSTLGALVRELLSKGRPVDMELLGVVQLRRSKIQETASRKK